MNNSEKNYSAFRFHINEGHLAFYCTLEGTCIFKTACSNADDTILSVLGCTVVLLCSVNQKTPTISCRNISDMCALTRSTIKHIGEFKARLKSLCNDMQSGVTTVPFTTPIVELYCIDRQITHCKFLKCKFYCNSVFPNHFMS